MENNQINEIVETALSNLQRVAEVNTIVGKPLVTVDGTTIVPVSQITFAFILWQVAASTATKVRKRRFRVQGWTVILQAARVAAQAWCLSDFW